MGHIHGNSGIKFHVEQLSDEDSIKSILYHQDIWPTLLPSSKNLTRKVTFSESDLIFWGLYANDDLAGVVAFKDMDDYFFGDKVYIADIGIIKEYRGAAGYALGRLTLGKFFSTVDCNNLVCKINRDNKKSLFYAQHIGFRILKKFKKNYIVGVKKYE